MKKLAPWPLAGLLLVGLLVVAVRPWRWFEAAEPQVPLVEQPADPVLAAEPSGSAAAAMAPTEVAPSGATADVAAATVAEPDLTASLIELIGPKAFHSMFLSDDLVRRLVATIDNLGRDSAPASLWPMVPAEGRFETGAIEGNLQSEAISASNAARYAPHVLLLETISLPQLVRIYRSVYPALQRGHAELGLPTRSFHVRLLAVLDLLLATPERDPPIAVLPPDIRGPIQPLRPWVLYVYADPALESLAAGQKILLRMEPAQRARVKARLAELRALLAAAGQP